MKAFIICLLFGLSLSIVVPLSFAQQNQISQKPNSEVETLKIQLQTVQNEKMELTAKLLDAQAKLADANTKLINAELGKFERELRDSNQKWLIGWIIFFLTVLAVVGTPLWLLLKSGVNRIITNLKSNADQLISDEVERSLTGFKKAVGQVNILQDQIRILEREHAASVLGDFMHYKPEHYPEQVKALPEQALLDVFSDETRHFELKGKAAEVLTYKQSPRLVFPVLKYLNSVIDSDFDWENDFRTQYYMGSLINLLGYIDTLETYEGLKKFLERLLTEKPEDKGRVLTPTAFSLAYVSNKLNKEDLASTLKKAIPFLKDTSFEDQALKDLAKYFDRFNEPEGIKDILTNGLTNMMPEVENSCLALLQKHDPEFVEDWKARKVAANTETEESS